MAGTLKRSLISAFAVCLIAFTLALANDRAYFRRQTLNHEFSKFGLVVLDKGCVSARIDVRVINSKGYPLAGEIVCVENSSGGNTEVTDSDGSAQIYVGERDVSRISINGDIYLDRADASWIGYPSVVAGLNILVIKDLKANDTKSAEPSIIGRNRCFSKFLFWFFVARTATIHP